MKSSLANGVRAVLVVLFLGSAATPASADWLLTPYLGIVFGGAANTVDIDDFDEAFEQRFNLGGSLTWMGGGVIGFEVDYNYAPNFFQLTEGGEDFDFFDVNSSLSTLMGNLIVGIPVGGTTGGGVRPYAAGGIGLMRANISFEDLFDDLSTNELGINLGGGIHGFFSDNVGIRGDLRYFRALGDDDDEDFDDDFEDEFGLTDFDYWRATIGITFRFGG